MTQIDMDGRRYKISWRSLRTLGVLGGYFITNLPRQRTYVA